MQNDDVTKVQTRRRRLTSWRSYSYWELFIQPELQREFDDMLASRPVWLSRIFVIIATSLILSTFLLALWLE